MRLLAGALVTAVLGCGAEPPPTIQVVAVEAVAQRGQASSVWNSPQNTYCSGSATTTNMGTVSNTTGTANCQTTGGPQTITRNWVDIENVVEDREHQARYVISCRANVVWSKCTRLVTGDVFPARIDGDTMRVYGAKKDVHKFTITRADRIQPPAPVSAEPAASTRDPLSNSQVVELIVAGLGEDVVLAKIAASQPRFRLEPESLIALKKAGVSDRIIAAMLSAK